VLAPASLQQSLRLSDLERLSFSPDPATGTQLVTLESDWLDRLGQLLGKVGMKAVYGINVAAPAPADPARLVEHTFSLQNAVYNVVSMRGAWTRYFVLLFRYTAFSDEERDGLLKLCINTANGSVLDETAAQQLLDAVLGGEERGCVLPSETELPPPWTDERLGKLVQRALPERIHLHIAPFVRGLQRRLDRDLVRVHGYYGDLRSESIKRMQKRDGQAREQLRLEAIEREYPTKVEDLRQKYYVRVEVRVSQALELIMPVHRVELMIKRRKATRKIQLDWNPLLRKLDTPACESTYTQSAARVVCDDRLHLVSLAAHAPCSNCQKSYCRACQPRVCPKCKNGSE
jgi:hypothetical protein